MQDWTLYLVPFSIATTLAFVAVTVLWLRKLRETVALALTESASQQVRTAQRLGDALAQIQKQQRAYEQQLQLLAQANTQLRQGLVNVATRLEHSNPDFGRGSDHTVH